MQSTALVNFSSKTMESSGDRGFQTGFVSSVVISGYISCSTVKCRTKSPTRRTRRAALRRVLAIATAVGIAGVLPPEPDIALAADSEGMIGESSNDENLIDPGQNEPAITDEVFLDLRAGSKFAGRVTLGLYGDITPITVANFKTLVEEQYAGTAVYRIVPSLTIQMGDVLRNGGKKGRSGANDGKPIPPENYRVSHTIPGIVSMARDENGNIDSRFFIATRQEDSLYLDGRYVAFGRVLSGMDNLAALEKLASTGNMPSVPITIEKCGLL